MYDKLPTEIQHTIFTFLSTGDLRNVSLSCKYMYTLINTTLSCLPQNDIYVLPCTSWERVEYPYVQLPSTKKLIPRIVGTKQRSSFSTLDQILILTGDTYARHWIWKNMHRGIPPRSKHPTGMIISANLQWSPWVYNTLLSFSKRQCNKVTWMRIHSVPISTNINKYHVTNLFTSLMYSSRETLKCLVIDGNRNSLSSSSTNFGQYIRDSQCKLERLSIKHFMWGVDTTAIVQQNLVHLRLVDCFFSNSCLLYDTFHRLEHLTYLQLSYLTCGVGSVVTAVELLVCNSRVCEKLKHLVINGIPVGLRNSIINAVKDLSEKRLHTLTLKRSCVDSATLQSICTQQCTLVHLDISSNDLDSNALIPLSYLLSSPRCKLKKLNISSNLITYKYCTEFAASLVCNKSLLNLDISDNYIRYKGYVPIHRALSSGQPNIKYLDVSRNQISLYKLNSNIVLCGIYVLLAKNNKVKRINFKYNALLLYENHPKLEAIFKKTFGSTVLL